MRVLNLKRNVHDVAGKYRLLTARSQADRDMPRRMPGRRFDRQHLVELIAVVHRYELAGLDHRQYRILPGERVIRRETVGWQPRIPTVQLTAIGDICCVGESRQPAAVPQDRVPADMVSVKMG